MAPCTMGDLADWVPSDKEEKFFHNIVAVLDELYPSDWRGWVVERLEYKDLFGETISPDLECRLRFAIPTTRLAKAYSSDLNLSERRYKHIKRTMLRWPLGRALIYAPLFITSKIHPTPSHSKFLDTLDSLKTLFISRHEASKILRTERLDNTEIESTSSVPSTSKRSHSPDPSGLYKEAKLTDFMAHQNAMFEKLCFMVQTTNENVTRMLNENANPPQVDNESVVSMQEDLDDHIEQDDWVAPPLVEETLIEEDNIEQAEPPELELEDFTPGTKESEAKITKAKETHVNQGIACQRFGSESWQNIRYAEVQKLFQATPVFTALKVNSNLATVTPPWQLVSVLEKMDLCLGAITHGLLQQRDTFQEIYQKASPQVRREISKNFLAPDSTFRKTSDALLQYTCGKRAEVIQQRRAIYKPANKTLNELLHSIPPSGNHLFSEPQLGELVKEQGGVSKLFPSKFRRPTTTTSTNRPVTRRAPAPTSSTDKDRPQQIGSGFRQTANRKSGKRFDRFTPKKTITRPTKSNRKY